MEDKVVIVHKLTTSRLIVSHFGVHVFQISSGQKVLFLRPQGQKRKHTPTQQVCLDDQPQTKSVTTK